MQVLEHLVCRFAPPFFSPWRRTDGRPASQPVPPKTSRKPIQQKAAGSTAQAPEFFSLSHSLLSSSLVSSRPVPSATDPPGVSSRFARSLSLSLPLARLSTARHAFPTHAHFDGPVVLNLKQGGLDPPLLLLRLLHIP